VFLNGISYVSVSESFRYNLKTVLIWYIFSYSSNLDLSFRILRMFVTYQSRFLLNIENCDFFVIYDLNNFHNRFFFFNPDSVHKFVQTKIYKKWFIKFKGKFRIAQCYWRHRESQSYYRSSRSAVSGMKKYCKEWIHLRERVPSIGTSRSSRPTLRENGRKMALSAWANGATLLAGLQCDICSIESRRIGSITRRVYLAKKLLARSQRGGLAFPTFVLFNEVAAGQRRFHAVNFVSRLYIVLDDHIYFDLITKVLLNSPICKIQYLAYVKIHHIKWWLNNSCDSALKLLCVCVRARARRDIKYIFSWKICVKLNLTRYVFQIVHPKLC